MRKKTIEDYVELVYDLQKGNKRVHTNEIASTFDINPASVTEVLQKLSEDGYLNYKKYSGATLTKKGNTLAEKTKKRHDTLKEFLVILGVDKKIAEQDACEMEHILHKDTMESVIRFVEAIKKYKVNPSWLNRLKS